MSYPVIVAYGRTACTRARKGGLHDVHPVDYSAECLKGVIAKVPYVEEHPEVIGDVITGCAMAHQPDEHERFPPDRQPR